MCRPEGGALPVPEEKVSDHHMHEGEHREGPILVGVMSLLWQKVGPESLDRALGSELKGLENELRAEWKRLRESIDLPTV
jgi:hypothetical protein